MVDGNGALFGTLQGNSREVLQKITVELPKKHGRGGQSALRFARLREEKRHNYIRKVSELATANFVDVDKPNIRGLILAGSANFKTEISQSELFDKRLVPIILKIVDVSYGMDNGFNQAITLAEDALTNVKFVEEKRLISKFFDDIAQEIGLIVFGVRDTMTALEMGALDTLMVFENLDMCRYEIRNNATETTNIVYQPKDQEKSAK